MAALIKHYSHVISIIAIIIMGSCLVGCEPTNDAAAGTFDRSLFLVHMGDNIIVPQYEFYLESLELLHESCEDLADQPDVEAVYQARNRLFEAFKSWQHVALFDFGPAADRVLLATTNTYPTDPEAIEIALAAEVWIPGTPATLDNMGLPALDYLLNEGTAEEVSNAMGYGEDRRAHLLRLSSELKSNAEAVLEAWNVQYLETFKASTGTEMGSSMGELLNAFNRVFEANIRRQKLGLPSGISTFTQTPRPNLVEAPYAATWSVDLLHEAMLSVDRIYHGDDQHGATDLPGLDDYLISLGDVEYGQGLHEEIQSQLSTARQSVLSLEDPLSVFVVDQQEDAFTVYISLQALVVLWKVDMMSALGVLVTYQDNDGD